MKTGEYRKDVEKTASGREVVLGWLTRPSGEGDFTFSWKNNWPVFLCLFHGETENSYQLNLEKWSYYYRLKLTKGRKVDVAKHPLLPSEQGRLLAGTVRSSFSSGFFIKELTSWCVGDLLLQLVDLVSKFHSELLRLVPWKHLLLPRGSSKPEEDPRDGEICAGQQ